MRINSNKNRSNITLTNQSLLYNQEICSHELCHALCTNPVTVCHFQRRKDRATTLFLVIVTQGRFDFATLRRNQPWSIVHNPFGVKRSTIRVMQQALTKP